MLSRKVDMPDILQDHVHLIFFLSIPLTCPTNLSLAPITDNQTPHQNKGDFEQGYLPLMLSNLQTQRTLPPNTVIKCRLLFSRRVEWMVGEFFHWDVEIWAPLAYHLHIDKRREIRLHTVVKRVCALDVVGYWGTRFTLSIVELKYTNWYETVTCQHCFMHGIF